MVKGLKAYLYLENTVVIDKEEIKNSPTDKDFREVMLYIDEKHIREWAKELEMISEVEGQMNMDGSEEKW